MKGSGRGFTFIELIVAMGIFLLLGTSATSFMVMAVKTWRLAEIRRDMTERADLVFLALKKDLQCLYTDGDKAPLRALFYSDYDKTIQQRLFFSRTVPPPGADPRIAGSGKTMIANSDIDGVSDLRKLKSGMLRSPGDLLSVVFWCSKDEKLYRAARTPAKNYSNFRDGWWQKSSSLIAEGVMHIEYNFWSEKTRAWHSDPYHFGPSFFWDSTRGIGKERFVAGEEKTRLVFTGSGNLLSPRDDIYPRLIEVKLVIGFPNDRLYTFLIGDLDTNSKLIQADNVEDYPSQGKENFIKIDNEWISYEKVSEDGKSLLNVKRGRRGSQPVAHAAGAVLRYGVEFRMVVRTPCQMGGWGIK